MYDVIRNRRSVLFIVLDSAYLRRLEEMELQLDSSVEIENLLRFLRNADVELCVLVVTN